MPELLRKHSNAKKLLRVLAASEEGELWGKIGQEPETANAGHEVALETTLLLVLNVTWRRGAQAGGRSMNVVLGADLILDFLDYRQNLVVAAKPTAQGIQCFITAFSTRRERRYSSVSHESRRNKIARVSPARTKRRHSKPHAQTPRNFS